MFLSEGSLLCRSPARLVFVRVCVGGGREDGSVHRFESF